MATLVWQAEQLLKNVKRELKRGAFQAGSYARNAIRKDINRRNRGGETPSLPGEPPRKITGRLRGNIRFEVVEGPLSIDVYVGAHKRITFQAISLEMGRTETGNAGQTIDLKPRPFIIPAIAARKDKIAALLMGIKG